MSNEHGTHSDAPTLINIVKMFVGAGVGLGAILGGGYVAYLVVVYLQTY